MGAVAGLVMRNLFYRHFLNHHICYWHIFMAEPCAGWDHCDLVDHFHAKGDFIKYLVTPAFASWGGMA